MENNNNHTLWRTIALLALIRCLFPTKVYGKKIIIIR